MRFWRSLLVAVFAASLFGCGRGPDLSPQAASVLVDHHAAVLAAVVAEDRASAGSELAELRAAVADLRAQQEVSDARADRILSAAANVEGLLGLLPEPTPPPPEVRVEVREVERDDDEDKKRDKKDDDDDDDD